MKVSLHAVVSWQLFSTTSVTNSGADHPRGTAKLCLGEPKSAECKSGSLCLAARLWPWKLCSLHLYMGKKKIHIYKLRHNGLFA